MNLKLSLLVLISILSLFCQAEPLPQGPKTINLTLSEALKKGLAFSVDLKRLDSSVKQASDNLDKTRAVMFPVINATGSATAKNGTSTFVSGNVTGINTGGWIDLYSLGVTATQPLYVGGGLSAGIDGYKTQYDLARQNYLVQKQTSSAAIIAAFFSLVQTQDSTGAAIQNNAILKSYLDITSHYEKIGRSRRLDLLQAKVNYILSQTDIEVNKNNVNTAQANLRALLGDDRLTTYNGEYKIALNPIKNLTPEVAFDSAVKNNPTIRIAELNSESVDYAKVVDLATDRPNLSLIASGGYISQDMSTLFNTNSQNYSIGLNLTVPLFSGFSSFAKSAGYGEQKYQAERVLESTKINIRSQIESALATVESTYGQLKTSQESMSLAQEDLTLSNKAFQEGTASSIDVLSIQSTRYNAEKLLITTKFNYLQTLLTLRQLMGVDLEKIYVQGQ